MSNAKPIFPFHPLRLSFFYCVPNRDDEIRSKIKNIVSCPRGRVHTFGCYGEVRACAVVVRLHSEIIEMSRTISKRPGASRTNAFDFPGITL